jgi:hypothetical protein
MTYRCGNKGPVIVQSRLIYPSNVYPYGRKSLEVLEDIADMRYAEGSSWKDLGDIFYERYDFSVENLKRSIIRVNVAFNRLLTVGLIQALNIVEWRFGEREKCEQREPPDFITLSFLYREKLFFGVVIYGTGQLGHIFLTYLGQENSCLDKKFVPGKRNVLSETRKFFCVEETSCV